jgi:NADH-quinone oxidoreductase subunit J
MVLFLFVIMLLNLGSEQKLRERFGTTQGLGIALSIVVGGSLIFVVTRITFGAPGNKGLPPGGSIEAVGKALFTNYVYPFEMVSLILLAAVVGAVVLAKRHVE